MFKRDKNESVSSIDRDVVYHMEVERPIFSPFTKITTGTGTVYIDAFAAKELIKIWEALEFTTMGANSFPKK